MKKVLIVCMLAAVSFGCSAEELAGGILYGSDWAFTVSAPDGWVMDNEAWAQAGIYAVFYRDGEAPASPNPVIYANSLGLRDPADSAYDGFVDWDMANVSEDPNATVAEKAVHATRARFPARVVVFGHPDKGQFEEVVYLWYKGTVHLIVLTTTDPAQLDALEPALFDVVDSIVFMDKQ